MRVNKNEQVICVDVDDTLVSWDTTNSTDLITVVCPNTGCNERLAPHRPHIKIVQNRLGRGALIIVWSAGGYAWAEAVVKALGLEHENLHIYSKPIAYVDDKKSEEWMGEHIYLKPDSPYGK